jgi:hypothetical protein
MERLVIFCTSVTLEKPPYREQEHTGERRSNKSVKKANKKQENKPKENEKKYDSLMSTLIGRNPQAFLDLLYPGSRFVAHHRNKLADSQRQPDAVIGAVRIKTGKRFLAQPDIQTKPDKTIAERLMLYQVLLRWEHYKREKIWVPTSSSVLHLTKAHADMQLPLHWTAPGADEEDEQALDFYFKSVEMREKTPEEILRLGHLELLPLLPATQGGSERSMIEWVMEQLQECGDIDMPHYGYYIAGLTLEFLNKWDDLKWLTERYKMIDEKFRDSPIYRMVVDEGILIGEERGEARGIAIGEERGKAEGIALGKSQTQAQTLAQLRKKVMGIVITRFASLIHLAQEVVAAITDVDALLDLLVVLGQAQSSEQAEQLLLNAQAAG